MPEKFIGSSDDGGAAELVELAAGDWLDPDAELLDFDHRVHEAEDAGPTGILVTGSESELERAAPQIAIRYQRLSLRKNAASSTELFGRVLQSHQAAHPRSKPLVRADWEHAIDTWQWVLALDPDAGSAVQIAALFHDIERLISEADTRLEHHAPDYLAFKLEHARRGGEMVKRALSHLDAPPLLVRRVAMLVEKHEQPAPAEELALLNDADALSFFSLNSAGFLAYYGETHTETKVEYTLRRLRPPARELLANVKHPRAVERMLQDAYRRVIAAQNSANSSTRRGGLV